MVLQYANEVFEPDGSPAPVINFPSEEQDLLASRLIVVGNLLRNGATQRFRHMFGLSLVEWLVVVQLASEAPLTINELAARVGLDYNRANIVITRLSVGGLAVRTKKPSDGHQARLSLTPRGRSVFIVIMQNWLNKELVLGLAPDEVDTLNNLLGRLAIKARKLVEQESRGLP
jgi:MarR family transcriptional regulator, organic hydroperoxide resistance regulator